MLRKGILGLASIAIVGAGYWGYTAYQDYQSAERIRLIEERNEIFVRELIAERNKALEASPAEPKYETKIEQHPNGEKKSEIHYKNGLKHGTATYWDEGGQKLSETEYAHNLKNGSDLNYRDGVLVKEEHYLAGKLHGIQRIFGKENKILKDAFYQNGLREGTYLDWYDRYTQREASFYRAGKPHGTYKTWYVDGDLKEESQYIDGLLNGDNYSWDGDEGRFINQNVGQDTVRSKYHEVYDHNHLLSVSSTYATGEPRSLEEYLPEEDRIKVTQWYKDGTVSMEAYKRQLDHKELSFVFIDFVRFYAPNGQLLLETFYNDRGDRIGRCTHWKMGDDTEITSIIEYDDIGEKGLQSDYKVIQGKDSCKLSDKEVKLIFGTKYGKFIPYTHVSNIRNI